MDAYKLAFEKKYPEVEVNVYRAISGEVLTKLKTEKEAQQVSVDVVWVADFSSANSLKELDLLAKYDSAEGAAIDPAFKDSEGYYYGSRIINMVLQYRHSGARFLEGSSLARVFPMCIRDSYYTCVAEDAVATSVDGAHEHAIWLMKKRYIVRNVEEIIGCWQKH